MAIPEDLRFRKLFVGCLPWSKNEDDVKEAFSQCGAVQEVKLFMHPDGRPKGAGFVIYEQDIDATLAIETLQGYTFEGAPRGLNIKLADHGAEMERQKLGGATYSDNGSFRDPNGPPPPPRTSSHYQQNSYHRGNSGHWGPPPPPHNSSRDPRFKPNPQKISNCGSFMIPTLLGPPPDGCFKLFVGCLPFSKSEEDLLKLFGKYGHIWEIYLMRNADGKKTGSAFITYMIKESADQAIENLDGYTFEGAPRSIKVQPAGTQSKFDKKRGADEYLAKQAGSYGFGNDAKKQKLLSDAMESVVNVPGAGDMNMEQVVATVMKLMNAGGSFDQVSTDIPAASTDIAAGDIAKTDEAGDVAKTEAGDKAEDAAGDVVADPDE